MPVSAATPNRRVIHVSRLFEGTKRAAEGKLARRAVERLGDEGEGEAPSMSAVI